jgi:hypothetical protein
LSENIRAGKSMRKKPGKPLLSIVSGSVSTAVAPPATLAAPGAKLWRSVLSQYDIRDAGGLATLEEACVQRDRATEFAAIVARDGSMIRTKSGPKEHPLIRHEREARALMCRLLQRLGLDMEPVRPGAGRPSSGVGITFEQMEEFRRGHETDED